MFTLILASGAGAIQGGIILIGLLAALAALPLACYAAFRKKERSPIVVSLCFVSLFVSIGVAGIFGPPHTWSYWGAYLPWIPLAVSLFSLWLALKRRPIQRATDNDGAAPHRV